ncbi:MAG: hypothetical protein QOD77_1823 [Thermoplasmata archaeon]|jgi:hypothetical protein|nr:hypothetical protein [Thermoplasmata archaeon]
MADPRLDPAILEFLNLPSNRGRWHYTRDIAQQLFGTDWASPEEIVRVRAALKRLERDEKVAGFGYFREWRSTQHPEAEAPEAVRAVLAIMREQRTTRPS